MSNKKDYLYIYTYPRDVDLFNVDSFVVFKLGETNDVQRRMDEHDKTRRQTRVEKSYDLSGKEENEKYSDKHIKPYLLKNGFIQVYFGKEGNIQYIKTDECSSTEEHYVLPNTPFNVALNIMDVIINNVFKYGHAKNVDFNRNKFFNPRNEQQKAVDKTSQYFQNPTNTSDKKPRFLWNAKPRFGKTFTTFKLANKMNWNKVLVITFKPNDVKGAWEDDLMQHDDFREWVYVDNWKDFDLISKEPNKKIVYFTSLQYLNGKKNDGNDKEVVLKIREQNWDCLVIDEYHYGGDTERTNNTVYGDTEQDEEQVLEKTALQNNQEAKSLEKGLRFNYELLLSGTAFKAVDSPDFLPEQIFSWSQIDEQLAKQEWLKNNPTEDPTKNPYAEMPSLVHGILELPSFIKQEIIQTGSIYKLSDIFEAEEQKDSNGDTIYVFKHENIVRSCLFWLIGQNQLNHSDYNSDSKSIFPKIEEELKEGQKINALMVFDRKHSCFAMERLLNSINYYKENFITIQMAGDNIKEPLEKVKTTISSLKKCKDGKTRYEKGTITLTVTRLTHGTTVPEWNTVLMLRETESAELYFQSAFRCLSPHYTLNSDGTKTIYKEKGFIVDFSLNRTIYVGTAPNPLQFTLKKIADYGCGLNIDYKNSKVGERDVIEGYMKVASIFHIDQLGNNYSTHEQTKVIKNLDFDKIISCFYGEIEIKDCVDQYLDTIQRVFSDNTISKKIIGQLSQDTLDEIKKIQLDKKQIEKQKKGEVTSNPELDSTKEKVDKNDVSDNNHSDNKEKQDKKTEEINEKVKKIVFQIPKYLHVTEKQINTFNNIVSQNDTDTFGIMVGFPFKMLNDVITIGVKNGHSELLKAINKLIHHYNEFSKYNTINRKKIKCHYLVQFVIIL
jgi:hypothetical protein